jgi:hypothetical protein
VGLVERRRAAAQVAVGLALCLAAGAARAREMPGCAGDGAPRQPLAISGLASLWGVPLAGPDALLRGGAPVDGSGVSVGAMRVALCGRIATRYGRLSYDLAYEPWSTVERARPDAQSWGRLLAAEIGFQPWRWLTFFVGVRKLAFSYGHDEPEGVLALPWRPWLATSITPDRRLGVTLDADFGAARLIVGAYQGAYDLGPTIDGGLVIAGRVVAEPLGPVGPSISTVHDAPEWRRRARFGLGASLLIHTFSDGSGYALGVDAPFKFGPLGLVVEYLFADGMLEQSPWFPPVARLRRQGVWAQAALMLLRPYLELEARYEWVNEPGFTRFRYQDLTVGVTSYLVQTLLRAQLAYSHKFHAERGWEDDALVIALTASF